MNMFARFDENPVMTLQDIKETNITAIRTDMKTVFPPQTKFAGGITMETTMIQLQQICIWAVLKSSN